MNAYRRRPMSGKDHVELHMTPGEAAALRRFLTGKVDPAANVAAADCLKALVRLPKGDGSPECESDNEPEVG